MHCTPCHLPTRARGMLLLQLLLPLLSVLFALTAAPGATPAAIALGTHVGAAQPAMSIDGPQRKAMLRAEAPASILTQRSRTAASRNAYADGDEDSRVALPGTAVAGFPVSARFGVKTPSQALPHTRAHVYIARGPPA